MFVNFFYKLKDVGIPVSPTSFLTLHKALGRGLVNSLEDFYTASRAILIKSERYFDLYDQVFAHYFQGADLPDPEGFELDEVARVMLEAWLKNPEGLAEILGMDESELMKLTPEELIEYFKERLNMEGTSGSAPVATLRWVIPAIIPGVCEWGAAPATNRR
jgi:uncharacterized protein with von Willebrand factor type A (vWA) domain